MAQLLSSSDMPQVAVTQPNGEQSPVSPNDTPQVNAVDHPWSETFPAISPSLVSDSSMDAEEMRLKALFDDAVVHQMDLPKGHDRVGVLIIKWADDLDQLNCKNEVDRLQQVLKDSFKFETHLLNLENDTMPQLQLHLGIAKFVQEYNNEHNLLIVYYSGHGEQVEDKFEMFATTKWTKKPRIYEPRTCWNTAEAPLFDTESEVLVIFDSCHASNLMRKGCLHGLRAYELLAASTIDGLAVIPGRNSFTESLIQCLKTLAEKQEKEGEGSFTTWRLAQEITKLRPKYPPILWDRRSLESGSHIRLAPVRPKEEADRDNSYKNREPVGAYLKLTIQLGSIPEDDQVEELARNLPEAFTKPNLVCRRIELNSLRTPERQQKHQKHERQQKHMHDIVQSVMMQSGLKRRISATSWQGSSGPNHQHQGSFGDVNVDTPSGSVGQELAVGAKALETMHMGSIMGSPSQVPTVVDPTAATDSEQSRKRPCYEDDHHLAPPSTHRNLQKHQRTRSS